MKLQWENISSLLVKYVKNFTAAFVYFQVDFLIFFFNCVSILIESLFIELFPQYFPISLITWHYGAWLKRIFIVGKWWKCGVMPRECKSYRVRQTTDVCMSGVHVGGQQNQVCISCSSTNVADLTDCRYSQVVHEKQQLTGQHETLILPYLRTELWPLPSRT